MKIHVRPAQPQQLTPTQADTDRQLVDGPQSVVTGRRQELTPFLGSERDAVWETATPIREG
ncbi:hypothetical protein AB0912_00890 [Streptomyces sp. NPDC007084]|uniref:hypothetical protein n=1 Tax=Streptomyces sp. NPDC007084 TaxID=3154313 RepID=UPI0034517AA8